jgi:hypothetical protein
MKKLLVAMTALLSAGYASAGDYHISTTLRCSQCHTMHASRAHQLNGAAVDADYPLASQGTPNRNLLIQDGTNETCLACHDNKTTFPDVLGLNTSSVAFSTANARSAGALNGTVGLNHTPGTATDVAATAYADWMGHTLGTDVAPPGWVGVYEPSPQENFNCANCHAVHGSAAYRNLGLSQDMGLPTQPKTTSNPFYAAGPTYNTLPYGGTRVAAAAGTVDVLIAPAAARSYVTADVTFGIGSANTTAKNGMNAYCAVCHGNFHGAGNTVDQIGGVDFVRHPTSTVQRADASSLLAGGQTGLVRPAWVGTAGASGFEAACLSCHKGHGNARGYALIYPDNDGAAPADYEQGDAAAVDVDDGAGVDMQYPLRNLCITCHTQGR